MLKLADRVKESTTTTGTGTVSLGGTATGFQTFASGIGDTNSTYYCIAHSSLSEWEVGIGTFTASGALLSRDTVLANSLGNTTKINFSSGSKDVFTTIPASVAQVLAGGSGVSQIKATALSMIFGG